MDSDHENFELGIRGLKLVEYSSHFNAQHRARSLCRSRAYPVGMWAPLMGVELRLNFLRPAMGFELADTIWGELYEARKVLIKENSLKDGERSLMGSMRTGVGKVKHPWL